MNLIEFWKDESSEKFMSGSGENEVTKTSEFINRNSIINTGEIYI